MSLPASVQSWSSEHLYGICSYFVNSCFTPGIYCKENGSLLVHQYSYLEEFLVKCFQNVSRKYNCRQLFITCTSCSFHSTTVHLHNNFCHEITLQNLNDNHSKHLHTPSITTQSVHQVYSYSMCLQLHTIFLKHNPNSPI